MKDNDPTDYLPTREEAVELILSKANFGTPPTEYVPLSQALNRYAAGDLTARYNLPNSLTSRMDGISIRFDEYIAAGGDTSTWQEGREYVFTNTGVAIPEGYDTSVVIENVEIEDGRLIITSPPKQKGERTNNPGDSVKAGELMIYAYEYLAAGHLATLATGGYSEVPVLAKPNVAIIPSGNELVPVSMVLPTGKNVETNSVLLSAKVQTWDGIPHPTRIVPDDQEQLLATLLEAAAQNDIVIFNAGSSKGTDDFQVSTLEAAGELLFKRVAYGPGHHTAFAVVDGTPVLGLVGPPTGVDFNADFYLRPLIAAYYRQPYTAPPKVMAHLLDGYVGRDGVRMWMRGILRRGNDGLEVKITPKGSAYREGRIDANCYIHLQNQGGDNIEPGGLVEVELREPYDVSLLGLPS
jgi:molybdopterin molybdotransferase/putative molybdopterin biosynthesis protein